jgi:hypothetical protein
MLRIIELFDAMMKGIAKKAQDSNLIVTKIRSIALVGEPERNRPSLTLDWDHVFP